MDEKQFDFTLIRQVNYSLGFLFKAYDEFISNPNKPIKEVIREFGGFDDTNKNPLINPGIALSVAFMYFIYPNP